jgi:hypothetical protein
LNLKIKGKLSRELEIKMQTGQERSHIEGKTWKNLRKQKCGKTGKGDALLTDDPNAFDPL